MIKQTINEYTFEEAFRAIRPDNFSYQGLQALYEYLAELSDDIGEDIELDVIAICCDYREYDSALDCVVGDGYLDAADIEGDDDEEREEFCLEYLRDHTAVIVFHKFDLATMEDSEQASVIVGAF